MSDDTDSAKTISLPVKTVLAVVELAIAFGAGLGGSYLHANNYGTDSTKRLDTLESHQLVTDKDAHLERQSNREAILHIEGEQKRILTMMDTCKDNANELKTRVHTLETWIYDQLRKGK